MLKIEDFYTLKKDITSLRVRSGPGIKYSKIGIFKTKDSSTIASFKMNGETRWVKINYGEEEEQEEGWVSYKHLLLENPTSFYSFGVLYKVKTKNKKGSLNVRKKAGVSFQKLKTLTNGTSGLTIKKAKKVKNRWWVKVSRLGQDLGWVNSQYLDSYNALSYVVLYGDTMQSIASKYGVTWLNIAKDNKILPPYKISSGQVIEISIGLHE
jgi:uncharacterized protein YgiM (DUF1202 family)